LKHGEAKPDHPGKAEHSPRGKEAMEITVDPKEIRWSLVEGLNFYSAGPEGRRYHHISQREFDDTFGVSPNREVWARHNVVKLRQWVEARDR
jgi:hypothetical protein